MTKSSKTRTHQDGPVRVTHEMTEYYIRRGRQLRSEFYAQMFRRLGRAIAAGWQSANRPWRSAGLPWREHRSAH